MDKLHIILLSIIVLLLINDFVTRILTGRRERDLLNRIMARDYGHYVAGTLDLKEPAGAGGPSAEEVAQALNEEQDGYAVGGVPVT